MCAIYGSDSLITFNELIKLNAHRGGHSFSIAEFFPESCTITWTQGFGPMKEQIEKSEESILIGHVQAPTTEQTDSSAIHPSVRDESLLWHNGIIKEHQLKQWCDELNICHKWDTKGLLDYITSNGFESLSEVDGSFACLYKNRKTLSLFRNSNCPMFIKGSTFSSTKFQDSVAIEDGIVYNYEHGLFKPSDVRFKTKETFYWSFD